MLLSALSQYSLILVIRDWTSKDTTAKEKMKDFTDRKRRVKKSVIEIGDLILIRQRKENKFSTKFDPKLFQVTKVKLKEQ